MPELETLLSVCIQRHTDVNHLQRFVAKRTDFERFHTDAPRAAWRIVHLWGCSRHCSQAILVAQSAPRNLVGTNEKLADDVFGSEDRCFESLGCARMDGSTHSCLILLQRLRASASGPVLNVFLTCTNGQSTGSTSNTMFQQRHGCETRRACIDLFDSGAVPTFINVPPVSERDGPLTAACVNKRTHVVAQGKPIRVLHQSQEI